MALLTGHGAVVSTEPARRMRDMAEEVLERAEDVGMDRSKAEHEIEKLRRQGEVYEPSSGHLRTT